MSDQNRPWAEAEIDRAKEILGRHTRVDDAIPEISRLVRPVKPRALRTAFQRAGQGPPSRYLAQAIPTLDPATGGLNLPPGQRLKGVSTLSDAEGQVDREWVKTERASDDPPAVDPTPPGFAVTAVSTMLDGQGQARVQWVRSEQEDVDRMAAFEAACKSVAERFAAGLAPSVQAPASTSADWLSAYVFGDPHVGMLAHAAETGNDNHDLKIGVSDLDAGLDLAVEAAPAADVGLLVNVGDFFHAEDDRQVTPGHGHKLDVDGRWHKVLRAGLGFLARATLRMLTKHAEVWLDNRPGNHDPNSARMIALWLEAYFRDEPRVRVLPNSDPYNVIEWGRNMIVTCHGDGAKRLDVPGLSATRWPEAWGRARFRVAYTGHIHHETAIEKHGMIVESFQTLAARDAWHAHKGYGAGRSLSVVSHHKQFGPRLRSKIDLVEVRGHQGKDAP